MLSSISGYYESKSQEYWETATLLQQRWENQIILCADLRDCFKLLWWNLVNKVYLTFSLEPKPWTQHQPVRFSIKISNALQSAEMIMRSRALLEWNGSYTMFSSVNLKICAYDNLSGTKTTLWVLVGHPCQYWKRVNHLFNPTASQRSRVKNLPRDGRWTIRQDASREAAGRVTVEKLVEVCRQRGHQHIQATLLTVSSSRWSEWSQPGRRSRTSLLLQ